MPRRIADEDWDEDDYDDNDSSDEESTIPCPYCERPIHEDAPRCPYCENYISAEDAPPVRKSRFIILGTILAIAAIYWWFVH